MTIETSNLIGGLLCGALLGVAGSAAAIWLLAGRMPARMCVRLARRFLADLKGDGRDQVLALFRARAALGEMERILKIGQEPLNAEAYMGCYVHCACVICGWVDRFRADCIVGVRAIGYCDGCNDQRDFIVTRNPTSMRSANRRETVSAQAPALQIPFDLLQVNPPGSRSGI